MDTIADILRAFRAADPNIPIDIEPISRRIFIGDRTSDTGWHVYSYLDAFIFTKSPIPIPADEPHRPGDRRPEPGDPQRR